MADQRAGIDFGRYRHAVVREKLLGVLFRTPVAGDGGELAYHQAFDVGARRLLVILVRAVVADLGIREHDDLAGIGGIGEDFLIAGDGGVEDHLAKSVFLRTKALALEDRSVFQGENCLIQSGLPSRTLAKECNYY